MIDLKTLSAEWIAEKRKKYSKDPTLMESMIYALYLLEQLQLSGLEFIFKGGTSLILLMKEPKRFSVDIDIIVSPKIGKEELEIHLSKIETASVFSRIELDERRSYQASILKAHYKFVYNSNFATKNQAGQVISNPEREILLDILFAENHYPQLVEIPLETDWILQDDERIAVTTPDINSILGDKLTAFAPNTTGIPYNAEKEKEILEAQVASAKSAYLASVILANSNELQKFNETIPLNDYLITDPDYNFLNKRLKFVAKGEALFYWFQTIELLTNQTDEKKNEA